MDRLHKDNYDAPHAAATREFPAEAFDYQDDVTPEAVDLLRKKAEARLGDRSRWKQVDGFGQVIPA